MRPWRKISSNPDLDRYKNLMDSSFSASKKVYKNKIRNFLSYPLNKKTEKNWAKIVPPRR